MGLGLPAIFLVSETEEGHGLLKAVAIETSRMNKLVQGVSIVIALVNQSQK